MVIGGPIHPLQDGRDASSSAGVPGSEFLFQGFPPVLRIHLTASDARKTGNYMLEHQLDRPTARRASDGRRAQETGSLHGSVRRRGVGS